MSVLDTERHSIQPPFLSKVISDQQYCADELPELKERAESDPAAALAFGVILFNGKQVKKDVKSACNYFQMAAKAGNAYAEYNLGVLINEGFCGKPDDFRSCHHWESAAVKGVPEAQCCYASCLLTGRGQPMNVAKAYQYYQQSLEQSCNEAAYGLGVMYENEIFVTKKLDVAASNYKIAADAGYSRAKFAYALMLLKGEGVPVDNEEGLKYLKSAAEERDVQAMYVYGRLLEDGFPDDKPDLENAEKYLKRAADTGYAPAEFAYYKFLKLTEAPNINEIASKYLDNCIKSGISEAKYERAMLLMDNEGADQTNKQAALKLMDEAATDGVAEAEYQYGMWLWKGITGVLEPNAEKAFNLIGSAAKKEHSEAMYAYGYMLKNGEGCTCNEEAAAEYYKLAADAGIAKAQYNYALCLDTGVGIAQNKPLAGKYYHKAAKQGIREAQCNLGMMLINGDGIKKNDTEAVKWLKSAARQGVVKAYYQLGLIYRDGTTSVPQDLSEAADWLKKAADEGVERAQYLYGMMCYRGNGVKADFDEAAKYLKLCTDKLYAGQQI